jgi:Arc/MetJ family transcription regulator
VVSVARTNIDIDDELVERAMRIYRLPSKREAVDYALRRLVGEPMGREEALAMRGRGWGGDLELSDLRAPDDVVELSAPRDTRAS